MFSSIQQLDNIRIIIAQSANKCLENDISYTIKWSQVNQCQLDRAACQPNQRSCDDLDEEELCDCRNRWKSGIFLW